MSPLGKFLIARVMCILAIAIFTLPSHAQKFSVRQGICKTYTISESFTEVEKEIIKAAADHINSNVDCTCLKYTETDTDALAFVLMDRPEEDEDKGKRYIGFYEAKLNRIRITNKLKRKDEYVPMAHSMFFKLVLHEIAHWLGMPGSHAFTEKYMRQSHLTPIIAHESAPKLYRKDIEYLEGMLCKSEKDG